MKLRSMPSDDKLHTYCLRCRLETANERSLASGTIYVCSACTFASPRALIIDPAITWWLDRDGEYWHEDAGVFVHNTKNEFLFLERVRYPSGLTIPAGHVDRREGPLQAVHRELYEEAGLRLPRRSFRHIAIDNIVGDKCRRGSDAHRWHIYTTAMRPGVPVKVNPSEVIRPTWLSLPEALRHELPFAIRSIITKHAPAILRAS